MKDFSTADGTGGWKQRQSIGEPLENGLRRDLAGNLTPMQYGNGVTSMYQYDSLNRLTNLVWNPGTSPLASFAYTLGPSGNRIGLSETISSTVARTYAWQYDKLYRLTNETVTGTTPTGTLGYQYDAVGNRLARTSGLGLSSQSLSYGTNDWMATDTCDANGNTLDSSGANYQYDFENRLTNFNNGQVVLVYDADGNRVKKTTGTTTTLYLVGMLNPSGYPQVLEELTVAGGATNLSRAYTWGLSLISQRISGSSTNFYGFDGHGSTRFLTDLSGNIANTYTYDAYGNLINSSAIVPNDFLYCCYQNDPDIGLVYDNARYLNTGTGRFWTSDLTEGDNEDPLSLHKYLYAEDNPVDGSDPTGNADFTLADISLAAGIVGGLAALDATVTFGAKTHIIGTLLTASYAGFHNAIGNVANEWVYYNKKQAEKVVSGLIATATAHVAKLEEYGSGGQEPQDPRDGWKKEIKAALDRAKRIVQKRFSGDQQTQTLKQIDDLANKAGVQLDQ